MRWDRLFEDLEDQLASELEAERAVLDSEAERVRLSRVTLRERAVALAADPPALLSVELADGAVLRGRPSAVGADWLGLDAVGSRGGGTVVPLHAVVALGASHVDVLRSARPEAADGRRATLAERMTLGFVARDLARRRAAVAVHALGGRTLIGTIDRAGADHLDLALHEPGTPRRADEVTGFRLVPYAAMAWLRVETRASLR